MSAGVSVSFAVILLGVLGLVVVGAAVAVVLILAKGKNK